MDEIEVGEIFTISDDNDEEQSVEVLAKLTLDGTDFVAVSFVEDLSEESEDDIDIFFLKIDEEGDLSGEMTDEEFQKVTEAFESILDEEEESD